mgnify:FL=1
MNFTGEIKRDLLAHFPAGKAGAAAALAAILSTCGSLKGDGFEVVSENEKVAEYFLRLLEMFGVRPELTGVSQDPKRKRDKLAFSCGGEDARRIISMTRSLREHLSEDEQAALCYLRAAFLGGGSCTLPKDGSSTGYHFECVFSSRVRAEEYCELLSAFELFCKLVPRGEKYVCYVKSREAISDLLSVLGAESALKKLDAVSARREANNNENRIQNCIAGNADKAAIASAAQTLAMSALKEEGRLAALSPELRESAEARLTHPTLSLSELASLLGMSKGGLNHRMRKLMKLYEETRS